MRKEFRLSGSGGQGIILAGIILAEAATRAGYHVVQSQSYGPEARGGASRAEVIVSDQPIDYPKVTRPDVFLALTPQAYAKYCKNVAPDGIVILDDRLEVTDACPAGALKFPILRTAHGLGREIVANMVSLGTLAALTKLIDNGLWEAAITRRVPRGTAELNILAFRSGYILIKTPIL